MLRKNLRQLFGGNESDELAKRAKVGLKVADIETKSALAYKILPKLTDRAIDEWLEPHYVAIGKSPLRRGQLFLFLSGSYGQPGRQLLIMQEAVELGYHAINLCYPNSWTVSELCHDSKDLDCHAKVRLQIIDGTPRTRKINISRANSLENRLVKLLLYLNEKQPEEGWSNYLDGELPLWESIVVAGHSQGGGQAAIIAKDRLVARVIMFGAPADRNSIFDRLAPWLSEPHVTPADRYYGLVHYKDPAFGKILQAWNLLGMTAYGKPLKIDARTSPYNNSHCLVTTLTPARPGKFHGCVVHDVHTPKLADNAPVLKEVWQYLLVDR
jgi:hypothetical protein